MLACACVPAASAGQNSTDGAAAKNAPAAKASTRKHHHAVAPQFSAGPISGAKAAGSTHTASAGKRSSHRKRSVRARGQKKIDSERVQAIQEALIREHYLSGEPTGTWSRASEEAMRRYQADHGWQSKTVPDSRALIKLGLGPSQDHLLNPESAMVTGPDAPRSKSLSPASQSPPVHAPAPASSQSNPPSPQ